MVDIDKLERLLAAATPGEWVQPFDNSATVDSSNGHTLIYDEGGFTQYDAALIVALHNSAPAMLTEIRELRATVATLGDSARAGANVLDAKDTEIRELRAENARLKAVVCNYVDPFDVAPEDEALVERVQRAALGEPQ